MENTGLREPGEMAWDLHREETERTHHEGTKDTKVKTKKKKERKNRRFEI